MNAMLRSYLVLLLALVVLGCATGSRGRGTPGAAGFFGPDASKLQKGSSDDWSRSYRNPNADIASYDKLILDPVGIWADADGNLRKLSATDRQRLANNFYKLIYKSTSRYFTIVTEPSSGTLRLRTALTNAKASSRTLDTISTVVPQLLVTTTLVGYATGKPAFTGEAAFAFRLTNATTGEVIALGADKRVGNRSLGGLTDSWSDVNDALEYWANLAGYRICAEKRLGNCEKP